MDRRVLRRHMLSDLHDPKHLYVEDMSALPVILLPFAPGDLFSNDNASLSRQKLMSALKEGGGGQPEYVHMRCMETRLQTLKTFPFPKQRRNIAAAGFFCREGSFLQELHCYQCGIGVRGWDTTSDPWLRHAHMNHYCLHINRFAVRSIAMDRERNHE